MATKSTAKAMKKSKAAPMETKTETNWSAVAGGLAVMLVLAIAAWALTKWIYTLTLPGGIPGKALEFPLWGAVLGLAGNFILKQLKWHEPVRAGFRTELFLKTGLILLGAGLDLKILGPSAGWALLQGIVMMSCVFFFSWWVSGLFKLDEKLRAVMSTAVSVCGVSAAIAAAGSVLAKKEQVTYVTTLVILVALPMMVLMPIAGRAMNLPDAVAGAWFGGNIDTTAAVMGAGTMYSEAAQQTASLVKNTQNAMIGVVVFLLALFFSMRNKEAGVERPSPRMIWDRFPKFVLGYVLAAVLFSIGLINGGKGTAIEAMKNWAFTLAFVGMGLELSLKDLRQMGWKPLAVFLIVTVFNTLLALGVASLLPWA